MPFSTSKLKCDFPHKSSSTSQYGTYLLTIFIFITRITGGGIIAEALHRITLIRFLTMLSNEGTLFVPADASTTLKILVHWKILVLVEIYLKVLISLMLSLWRSYIFLSLLHYVAYLACIGLFCLKVTINTWKINFLFYIEQYLSIPKRR